MYCDSQPVTRNDFNGRAWIDSATDAINMFSDWALGTGPENRLFGPNTIQSRDLANAYQVNAARDAYYRKNYGRTCSNPLPYTEHKGSFGPLGPFRAGLDPTEQFVGSFRVDIIPIHGGDTLMYIITNPTSFTSFFYGFGPAWRRFENVPTPGGNMYQTYIFYEPNRLPQ